MHPTRTIWFISLGFWALISVLHFTQLVVPDLVRGEEVHWVRSLSWTSAWWVWAALTPLVATIARRYPFSRDHLGRSLAFHLGVGTLVSLGHNLIETSLHIVLWDRFTEPTPAWQSFVGLLIYRFHYNLVIYVALLGAFTAFDNYRRYREQKLAAAALETSLAQARLQSLKAQLQPHFLFNTHHAILALMLKNETDGAIKMLTRLSDMLRMSLENHSSQFSSLQQELEMLDPYLEIQKVRFGDNLAIGLEIDPDTLSAEVPNLLLQPIVENAIRHGASKRSSQGEVVVSSRRTEAALSIQVEDNGPGLESPESIQFGIGLSNTRDRLRQIYGEDHSMEFDRSPLGGLRVSVTLPLQETRATDDKPVTEEPS